MSDKQYDIIVVGLGAMGSAALYQLARRGKKVLGIDQFSPPHCYGSSYGGSRIIRQAIGEGAAYVPLVLRSYEIWNEIEKAIGKELLIISGGLIVTDRAEQDRGSFFQQTVSAAEMYHIPYEILEPNQLRKRFPQLQFAGNEIGYYEWKAGILRCEACIEAQLMLAESYGAHVHRNEKVLEYFPTSNAVHVRTVSSVYSAEKVILSAGSWIGDLLGTAYSPHFICKRQLHTWYAIQGSVNPFLPNNFPVVIWNFQNRGTLYAWPAIDGRDGGVKINAEQPREPIHPDMPIVEVSEQEKWRLYQEDVVPYFSGLGQCIRAESCKITNTPDSHFIIDFHPECSQIIVASPCSGHGFKYSAVIGEILADLVINAKSRLDISAFQLSRLL